MLYILSVIIAKFYQINYGKFNAFTDELPSSALLLVGVFVFAHFLFLILLTKIA